MENEREENINITVEGGVKTLEIVHRKDAGRPHHDPETPTFEGDINSPANYLAGEGVRESVDKKKAAVLFNHPQGTVTLMMDATSTFGAKITGRLKRFRDLDGLGINQNKVYDLNTLRAALKFLGPLFADRSIHTSLMDNLQNTKVKMERAEDVSNDNRGNQSTSVDVKTMLPDFLKEPFYLLCPIFEGQGKEKFKVDLLFDADGRKLTCWLESVELKELYETRMKDIMSEQKSYFDGFVKIDQF